MNEFKKKELIERIAHLLDITPDMYNKSQSVVNGLTNFLMNQNTGIEIYKQGSFKLGTIVKPYQKDKYGDFDIDLVVQFPDKKDNVKPAIIKQILRKYLDNPNYEPFLDDEGKKCWTLNFPQVNGNKIIFHIDLLPCVDESKDVKLTIKPDEYKNAAIAITKITDKRTNPYTYEWDKSNPKGFAKWFDDVNYGKYRSVKFSDRQRIFENYGSVFNTIDDVGDDYTRSPLQMVIQILKRHRDVMFANTEREDFKPISIIITTLVGKIIEENAIIENNTYKLLNEVLKGLEYYSSLQTSGITSDFSEDFKTKKLILKRMQDGFVRWYIKNPANSGENLANKWNTNTKYVTEFFNWVRKAQTDLIDILDFSPSEILTKLKYCLGEDIAKSLEGFDFSDKIIPRPIKADITPKPYKV